MYKYLMVIILTLLSFPFETKAQKVPAFKNMEYLEYTVSYKVGIVNVDVATVTFEVKELDIEDIDQFYIKAVAKVNESFDWFYNLNDVYEAWMDSKTLKPRYLKINLKEGDYRYNGDYTYNWDSMEVFTWSKNNKREEAKEVTYKLSNSSFDALSLFYNLRSMDLDNMLPGKKHPLEVVFDDRIRKVNFWFVADVVKNIKGIGKVSVKEFRCELATEDGKPYQDGNIFTMMISNDKNKIPIYLSSPIKVGSVRVRLSNYRSLKYPFTALKK